jgi:hypothetical protein
LLFSHADIPVKELNIIIGKAAKALKWPEELQWVCHSLRHGGAQRAVAMYETLKGTRDEISLADLQSNIHMTDGTYNTCYGTTRSQRLNNAWARKMYGKGARTIPREDITKEPVPNLSFKELKGKSKRGKRSRDE